MFRSKNILITGGCGFIGSNYIDFLFKNYHEINVYNVDSLTYASDINFNKKHTNNPRYRFFESDICDKNFINKIFEDFSIDGVINFAAESHVDNSILNPGIFVKTNILGVQNLLDICLNNWMDNLYNVKIGYEHARFHQVSTDEVYGSILEGSFLETSPYLPNSPYSASKASADMLVRSYNKTYGLNTTISISSNNFGKNQNQEKLIPKLIKCIKSETFFPLYGDGKNVRDWIYVMDNCKAIDLIFNNSPSGESYNIGGGNEYSNIDLIKLIYKISGKQEKIKLIKDRYGHDKRYSINSDKIKNKLNWKNNYDFIEELSSYVLLNLK